MNLFERIHEIITKRMALHADEQTPVDTEMLTADVIDAHAAHITENPIPETPDDVVPDKPEPVADESATNVEKPEEKVAEA